MVDHDGFRQEARARKAARHAQARELFPRYRDYAERLWERADKLYGRSGRRMPRLILDASAGSGELAWVPLGSHKVHISPETVLDALVRRAAPKVGELAEGGRWTRPDVRRVRRSQQAQRSGSRSLLLHEWAHVAQKRRPNPRTYRRAQREGGAEAFEQLTRGRFHIGESGSSPDYDRWAKRVLRKRGRDYVLRRQFDG